MFNRRLLNCVPDSKKYIFLAVLLKWISLASNLLMIFAIVQTIRFMRFEISAFCVILACLCLNALCSYFVSVISFKASREVKKTLRSMIYEKLLKLGGDYTEKTQTAKIIQLAVEGVEQLEVYFGSYIPQFFYSIAAALTTFCVLAFINLTMALVLFICVPLIPLSIAGVQGFAKKRLSKYWDKYAHLADSFLENLQGLTTLKIFNADEYRQEKMQEEAEIFRQITMKVLSMQLNSIIVMDIVAYSGAAAGILCALAAHRLGSISLYECLACVLISADFFIPLRRLGSYFHTAMNGTAASKNIFSLLDLEDFAAGTKEVYEKDNVPVFEAENLSLDFEGRTALKDCCISIEKGSFTAFTGKSGSGKSSAAKVFNGIYRNYSGSVKLFGTELSDISPDSLFKFCMYISHKDWIFKGSVRNTLLEGNDHASDTQLWQALENVNLSDFVKENGGLDFEILENASNLSGGQKQRLSIARALLHDPQIFIFDEASSNIDAESESDIISLLHKLKGKKTIIMISHRIENSINADKIYEFENGTVKTMEAAR